MITSGNDDEAASGLREVNAPPKLAPKSKALPGIFKSFCGIFFEE